MAQWLGPHYDKEIIYNDMRANQYCAVILNVDTMQERVLPLPVYTVSSDGTMALTLDFSRLHQLRKGYGYAALPETTKRYCIASICRYLEVESCQWRSDRTFKVYGFRRFPTAAGNVGSRCYT